MTSSRRGMPLVYWVFGFFVAVGSLILLVGGILLVLNASDNETTSVAQESPSPMPTSSATASPTAVAVQSTATHVSVQTPTPSATPTNTSTAMHSPTSTATPSLTATVTPTITASHTETPTQTPSATNTPSLTPTDTSTPTPFISLTPSTTPFPGGVEMVSTNGYDLTNILLIGADRRDGQRDFRTDVLVIASINHSTGTVNLLSLPRDLYVFIPRHGWDRINTAAIWGQVEGFPGGGIALLRETIRYNLGIQIDHYALVNFDGFVRIIDALNGVFIVVDCSLADYRLASPDLDPDVAANYEWVELDVGLHKLSGANALWYARSRATTSDFDRNERHQRLLFAIWQRFQQLDLWQNIPELWDSLQDTIVTDMNLKDLLSFVPMGINLNPNLIERHFIGISQVETYITPGGASVLRMIPVAVRQVIQDFMTPPTLNRLFLEAPRIEIVNESTRADLEQVAAAVLSDMAFAPRVAEPNGSKPRLTTVIFDFTGNAKGSSLDILVEAFNLDVENVYIDPDPDRTVDYRILLGDDYNSCRRAPNRG